MSNTATVTAPKTTFTVTNLSDAVKHVKEQRETTLTELEKARENLKAQLAEVDALLGEMGNPILVAEMPKKRGRKAKAEGSTPGKRGSGPRGENTMTLSEACEGLLLKYKNGLGRPDITVAVVNEMGYKTNSNDPHKVAASVYTGGINQLIKDGRVITVGQRPNTVYKHVNHATKVELAAFKAKA